MAVGGALFGNGRGGAPASKALVEFRAGKMTVSGSLVSPDKRKGMIQVKKCLYKLPSQFCYVENNPSSVFVYVFLSDWTRGRRFDAFQMEGQNEWNCWGRPHHLPGWYRLCACWSGEHSFKLWTPGSLSYKVFSLSFFVIIRQTVKWNEAKNRLCTFRIFCPLFYPPNWLVEEAILMWERKLKFVVPWVCPKSATVAWPHNLLRIPNI